MSEETPKKKRINSKAKGNGFEGQISKVLSEKLDPLKFRRSQSSGAILGGMNSRMLESYSEEARALFVGDVVPTNETDVMRDHGWKFKFALECKFYKDADTINQLMNNTKIKGWFDQAVEDAAKINKEPLLIFKFNRCDTYCAVRTNTIGDLPKNLERHMEIYFEEDLSISFFKFDEAILDLEWWKVKV